MSADKPLLLIAKQQTKPTLCIGHSKVNTIPLLRYSTSNVALMLLIVDCRVLHPVYSVPTYDKKSCVSVCVNG